MRFTIPRKTDTILNMTSLGTILATSLALALNKCGRFWLCAMEGWDDVTRRYNERHQIVGFARV